MATKNEREIFSPYLEKEFRNRSAVTYGEKLAVIEALIEETKNGKLPISADQVIRLPAGNPAVRAVREGRSISLDGSDTSGRSAADTQRKRSLVYAGLLFSLFPIFFLVWWLAARGGEEPVAVAEVVTLEATVEPTATATDTPQVPETPTPIPTATHTPQPTATVDVNEYEIVITPEAPEYSNIPIAMTFGGRELRISSAAYQAEWNPSGVEWWPGTHVRKVIALPYEEALMQSVFEDLDQTVTLRLRNGAVIQYQLNDLRRMNEFQIEIMTSQEPSIAIIMHGEEESTDRWVILGAAVQEKIEEGLDNVVFDQIDFITVDECTGAGMEMLCTISYAPADQGLVDGIALTDMEWAGVAGRPPTKVISSECLDEMCVAQISGIVRSQDSAILISNSNGTISAQLIEASAN